MKTQVAASVTVAGTRQLMQIEAETVGHNPIFAVHRSLETTERVYLVTHITSGGLLPGVYPSKRKAQHAAMVATGLLRPHALWTSSKTYEEIVEEIPTWIENNPLVYAALKAQWALAGGPSGEKGKTT